MQTTRQLAVSPVYFVTWQFSARENAPTLQIQNLQRTKSAHGLNVQVAIWCAALVESTNSGGFFVKRPNMQSAGRQRRNGFLNSPNVIRCGATATAHNVDQALRRKFVQ